MVCFGQPFFCEPAPQVLSDGEWEQLGLMLKEAELDTLSLGFERDWDISTRFKSAFQLNILKDPAHAMRELARIRKICTPYSGGESAYSSVADLLQIAWDDVLIDREVYSRKAWQYHKIPETKLQKPNLLFDYVEKWYDDVDKELQLAFAGLNSAQKDSLEAFLYGSLSESSDRELYEAFLKSKALALPEDSGLEVYARLFEKVNFNALAKALSIYHAGFDMLQRKLSGMQFSNTAPIIHQSKHGLFVIGTPAADFYHKAMDKRLQTRRVSFLLDPGGNDVYELDIHADWKQSIYCFIDLQGSDIYRSYTPGALFSVIGGIGYSLDVSGNDVYQMEDFAFSAFLGVNIHRDQDGSDTYKAGLFTQGAAMFGMALLIDEAGSDTYNATSYAQGMGCTKGLGALLDWDGDDVYYIGGKYLHKPLMPNDYRSMGQGMGFGFRPDFAGGVGLLYDYRGNDKYLGGVYAQGVGYWYAGGILIDESGNDVYNAIYYPQGSGIHLAWGMLFDGEGDDAYYTRNGPGQGAGHDWSLGILIDKAGNDAYSIPGGNGLGLSNSVGIFVDSSGDDRYERRDASSQGYANLSRGTGGIGLFLDAGGKDSYADTLFSDNRSRTRGSYGIAKDMELNILKSTKVEALAESESADIDSLAVIKDIFAIASEWEVGSSTKRVRRARTILISRDVEATEYIIKSKLGTKSGLEYRALEELVQKSAFFKDALFQNLNHADSLAAKNAMSLISATGDTLLISHCEELLSKRQYVTAALGSLGNIKSNRSVELLSSFMDHRSERYRYIAARSLVALKMPEANTVLQRFRDDSSFLVRTLVRHASL